MIVHQSSTYRTISTEAEQVNVRQTGTGMVATDSGRTWVRTLGCTSKLYNLEAALKESLLVAQYSVEKRMPPSVVLVLSA